MKRILMAMLLLPMMAVPETEVVDGIEWAYRVTDGKAQIGTGSSWPAAISSDTVGAISIPSTLGGYPVTSIGDSAFEVCFALETHGVSLCGG